MNKKEPSQTIIGVPGFWHSQRDISTSIAKDSGGYLFAGVIMMKIATGITFEVDIYDHDDALADAFAVAGGDRFSAAQLDAIRKHSFCLYLVGEGGSVESAKRFLDAGRALLACGGLGVKVESAGTAHSPDGWRQLCLDAHPSSLLKAFVTYVGGEGFYYSCGMHNLGYSDCIVDAPISNQDAANLIHIFLRYLLIDNPIINSGETFSIKANAPHYRLLKEDCLMFEPEDPFHNPNGVWKIIPA